MNLLQIFASYTNLDFIKCEEETDVCLHSFGYRKRRTLFCDSVQCKQAKSGVCSREGEGGVNTK